MNEKELGCKSCSKEITDRVPIIRVIEKLDALFSKNNLTEACRLLEYWESEARAMGDIRGLLEIRNEQIGLYRRTADSEKGLKSVFEAIEILESEKLTGISAATMYVNIATTLKAFGRAKEGIAYYLRAEEIYKAAPDTPAFNLAALYNNMGSSFSELKQLEKAEQCYLKAIEILSKHEENSGEVAVSYINLAHLYDDSGSSDKKHHITISLDKAWELLNLKNTVHDGNYAFICSKCAPSFGYFGQNLRKRELEARAGRIYEGT